MNNFVNLLTTFFIQRFFNFFYFFIKKRLLINVFYIYATRDTEEIVLKATSAVVIIKSRLQPSFGNGCVLTAMTNNKRIRNTIQQYNTTKRVSSVSDMLEAAEFSRKE